MSNSTAAIRLHNPESVTPEEVSIPPKPARSRKKKSGKPDKPYRDFPLFAHATKRWAKKIKGKLHYFGPWSDPDGALAKYLDQKDDLYAGRKPRAKDGPTIADLCNHFLTAKQAKLDRGELSPHSFRDYHEACGRLVACFGRDRAIDDLAADDFQKLLAGMKSLGPVAVGNEINRIRVAFKWGHDAGLYERLPRYGPDFKRPSRKTLRLERARRGPRMFEAAELRRILAAVGQPLKAMILLGVNAGLGNSDCGRLPLTALDLDGGWLNYHREKTGIPRRCPLWPETVTAIREALEQRPAAKDESLDGTAFVTSKGGSWYKDTSDNPVSKEMAKVLKKLGIDGHRNFYALRHTFETIGGESRDQVAVDHIMGHARDDMASHYRERISDDRLRAVTDHVRAWLFGQVDDAAAK